MKIMCIGDSLTFGYPFGRKYSWVHIIAEKNNFEMLNFGVNGQSSFEILNRVKSEGYFKERGSNFGSPENVNRAVILCGSNDFVFEICGVDDTVLNIEKIVTLCKEEGIEPVVGIPMLCNPKQASTSWFDGTDYHKVNASLKELEGKLVQFCKASDIKFINLQEKYKQCEKFVDGLHPTKEGYEFMANVIEEELNYEQR